MKVIVYGTVVYVIKGHHTAFKMSKTNFVYSIKAAKSSDYSLILQHVK